MVLDFFEGESKTELTKKTSKRKNRHNDTLVFFNLFGVAATLGKEFASRAWCAEAGCAYGGKDIFLTVIRRNWRCY